MAGSDDIAAELQARAERLERQAEELRDEAIELNKLAHRIASAGDKPASEQPERPRAPANTLISSGVQL